MKNKTFIALEKCEFKPRPIRQLGHLIPKYPIYSIDVILYLKSYTTSKLYKTPIGLKVIARLVSAPVKVKSTYIAVWCNGNISDFDSELVGSNPTIAATETLNLLFSKHSTKVTKWRYY